MSRWLRPHSGSALAAPGPVRLRVVPPRAPVPSPPQVCGPLCPPRLRSFRGLLTPPLHSLAAPRDRCLRCALGPGPRGAPAAARHLRSSCPRRLRQAGGQAGLRCCRQCDIPSNTGAKSPPQTPRSSAWNITLSGYRQAKAMFQSEPQRHGNKAGAASLPCAWFSFFFI
jgi:hypothetical protein